MKIEFDHEGVQSLLMTLVNLRGAVVDFRDAQGEISGKLIDIQIDAADSGLVLMIARPENNDWTSDNFTAPVPCKATDDSELFVY